MCLAGWQVVKWQGLPTGASLKCYRVKTMPTPESLDVKTRLRIAAYLRMKLRELAPMNQRALAEILGINEGALGRVLKYSTPVGLDLVLAIHRKLHVDANRLLDVDPAKEFFTPLPNGDTSAR